MSIRFIMGGSGSGKSRCLYNSIIEQSIRQSDRRFFVVVPEQFTLQTQLDLVQKHPDGGIWNIDVLSFERLAYRVFEELGKDGISILRDTGKSLLLRRAASELSDELAVFGRNFNKPGYVSEMKSLFSELAQYRVGPEELLSISESLTGHETLSRKLADIQKLQVKFTELLGSSYITGEELLVRLASLLPASRMVRDAVFAFDGFTGFTPVQTEVLRELMRVGGDLLFTVEADENEDMYRRALPPDSLFYLGTRMVSDMLALAEETGMAVEEAVWMKRPYPRFFASKKADDLAFLEEHIFRRGEGDAAYPDAPASISLHRLRNPAEEAQFAASTVARLIRSGCRYRDIAVITAGMDDYAGYLEMAFEEWNIPFFMDRRRDILQNAGIEWLRSAISVVEERFSYESVFRYLKSGMTDFSDEEVFLLEDYVLATGVRGFKQWGSPFTRIPEGQTEEGLEAVNEIRKKLTDELSTLIAAFQSRKRTVESITKALYQFMVSQDLQVRLKEKEDAFADEGRADLAKEYSQIYRVIIDLFDQFVMLLGEEKVKAKEYREMLEAGLTEARVGIIPPGRDQVVVGNLDRTRLTEVKHLLFLGFNDAWLPGSLYHGGILTDRDRHILAGQDIELSPDAGERAYMQQFYLYFMLTRPIEALTITYSNTGMDGKSLRPSYYLQELLRLFPQLSAIDEVPHERTRDITLSRRSALRYLAGGLQKDPLSDETWKELYGIFLADEAGAKEAGRLLYARYHRVTEDEALTEALARSMYGPVLRMSVTRLESFANCPYAFFLKYGLALKKRPEFSFRSVDEGRIIHDALYRYGLALEKEGLTWDTVSDEKREELCALALKEAAGGYGGGILESSARNSYNVQRLEDMLRRNTWALGLQMEAGSFEAKAYELSSDDRQMPEILIPLDEAGAMRINGKIDRLDMAGQGDTTYLKVLDYKSSSHTMDLDRAYHGLDLQLLVYLDFAERYARSKGIEGEVVPAGVFFHHVQNPVVEWKEGMDSELAILQAMRPKGLINDRADVRPLFDRAFEEDGPVSSNVVSLSIKKDGNPDKKSNVLSTEGFEVLSGHLRGKIGEYGKSILEGHIRPEPSWIKGKSGCDFCDFKSVCRFARGRAGCKERRFAAMKREEVLAALGIDVEEDSSKDGDKA